MNINTTNLLLKAEELISDGRLDYADKAEIPVENLVMPDKSIYKITLIAEFNRELSLLNGWEPKS